MPRWFSRIALHAEVSPKKRSPAKKPKPAHARGSAETSQTSVSKAPRRAGGKAKQGEAGDPGDSGQGTGDMDG